MMIDIIYDEIRVCETDESRFVIDFFEPHIELNKIIDSIQKITVRKFMKFNQDPSKEGWTTKAHNIRIYFKNGIQAYLIAALPDYPESDVSGMTPLTINLAFYYNNHETKSEEIFKKAELYFNNDEEIKKDKGIVTIRRCLLLAANFDENRLRHPESGKKRAEERLKEAKKSMHKAWKM